MVDRDAGVAASLRVTLTGVVIVSCLVVLIATLGYDWQAAIRDPATSPPGTPLAGAISTLGVVMMTVAMVAFALRSLRRWALGPAWMAFFCAVFAVDDYFTLHENQPTPEVLLFGLIGLVYGVAWLRYAGEAGTWLVWPVVMVFACFATSIGFDVVYARLVPPGGVAEAIGTLLEDSAKFAGIFTLMVFGLGEARAALRA